MCFISDGNAEVFRTTTHKARKEYRCCECGEDIQPGEHYEYHFQVFDGCTYTFKTCARCVWDRYQVFLNEIEEGCQPWESWCPFEGLRQHMEDIDMEPSPRTYRGET